MKYVMRRCIPQVLVGAFLLVLATIGLSFARVRQAVPQARVFTIMLDPAGDARTPGRTIDDTFERGISLQCTEWIKSELERRYSGIRVILTRLPGETLEPLQNASFANRLHADCYVSIHCYQARGEQPSVTVMHLMYQATDAWELMHEPLSCITYDQAHRCAKRRTLAWAQLMADVFQQDAYARKLTFNGILGVPFRPLVGILAPALAVEMSLVHKDDWQVPALAIVEALAGIVERSFEHVYDTQRED